MPMLKKVVCFVAIALLAVQMGGLFSTSVRGETPSGLVMYYTGGEDNLMFGDVTPNSADQSSLNEIVLTNVESAVRYSGFDFEFHDLIGDGQTIKLYGNHYVAVRNQTDFVGYYEPVDGVISVDYVLDEGDHLYVRPYISTVPYFANGSYSSTFSLTVTAVPTEEGTFDIASQENTGSSTMNVQGVVSGTYSYTKSINGETGVYIQAVDPGETDIYSGGGIGAFDLSYMYLKIDSTSNEAIDQVRFTFDATTLDHRETTDTISIDSRVRARRASLSNPSYGWNLFGSTSVTIGEPQAYHGITSATQTSYWEWGLTDVPSTAEPGIYEQTFDIRLRGKTSGNFYTMSGAKLIVEVADPSGPGVTSIALDYVDQSTGNVDGNSALLFGTVSPNQPAEASNAYRITNDGDTKIHYLWIHFNDFWPTETGNPGRIQVGGNADTKGNVITDVSMNSNGNCKIQANLAVGSDMWLWLYITDVGTPPAGNYQSDFAVQGTHNLLLGSSDAPDAGGGLIEWGDWDSGHTDPGDNPYWTPAYQPSFYNAPYDDLRSASITGVASGGLETNELITIEYSDGEEGLHWSALDRTDGNPDEAQNSMLITNNANTPVPWIVFQWGLWYPNVTGTPLFMRPTVLIDDVQYTGETLGTGDFRIEQITVDVNINVGEVKIVDFWLPDSGVDVNYDDGVSYVSEFTPVVQRNSFSGDPLIETLPSQLAWVSPTGDNPGGDNGTSANPSVISISKYEDANDDLRPNYTHVVELVLTVNTATRLVRVNPEDGSPISEFGIEVTKVVGSSRVVVLTAEDVTYADIATNSAGDYDVKLFLSSSEEGEFVVPMKFTGFNDTVASSSSQGNTELLTVSLDVSGPVTPFQEIIDNYLWWIVGAIAVIAIIGVSYYVFVVRKRRYGLSSREMRRMGGRSRGGPRSFQREGEIPFEDFDTSDGDGPGRIGMKKRPLGHTISREGKVPGSGHSSNRRRGRRNW